MYLGLKNAGQFSQDGNRVAYVEIAFDALTFGGTSAATSATFAVWRKSDGRVDRVQTITIAATDAGSPSPVVVTLHGESLYVTVESFTGGTAPNIAGNVWGRPVRH